MVLGDWSRDERGYVLVTLPCRHDQGRAFCDWARNVPHDDLFGFHRNASSSDPDAVRGRAGGERIGAADSSDCVETDFSGRDDAHALYRGWLWWRLYHGA